ncbi:MAG: GntP family permease [Prolixibacteraceae bacterium]|jgi:gluconate:H+ symporter, GntP family|nr:GntP family permease [Prolixibacteraceae bacterium]MBT6996878.1 GntP family permease [Prolixibacteraceae bacterium]MBT7395964.1 GntP family permease [Prolixibacteraceae bacterium]
MAETYWLILVLLVSILFIILGTTKLKMHPFIVLLLASYVVGAMAGLPIEKIASIIATGFGNIMAYIGIVIILGTIIGVILEKSNAAIKLAEIVLKIVGKRFPGLAMSIIGYIVSIPVFCDSAFVILSSLRKSLVAKTGKSSVALSIALATGLYATHTFVPPTPGPIAAAGNLGLDDQLGTVILFGLVVAIFAMLTGYFWASYVGKKYKTSENNISEPDTSEINVKLPSATKSLLPILVPIVLIAVRSIATYPTQPFGEGFLYNFLNFAGQPINALLTGFLLSFLLFPKFNKETLTGWIGDGITAAAPILLITGAGGAFGTILKETQIGDTLGSLLAGYELGIFLPFIIAAAFKTAQGSSTVALVATSALIAPLLSTIGLDSLNGKVLAVMATGAGAMTISHANDSFFWVVTQFSGMDVKTGYKTQTLGTLIQGVSSMVFIYFLTLIFL